MSMEVILTDTVTKTQIIKRQLPAYNVRCTFGGLEEFPKCELAVDIEKQFKPKFKIPRTKRQLVAELKRLCRNATVIYIATDIGIIGEYIGWRIVRALKLDMDKTKRLSFASLTESTLRSALQKTSACGFDHRQIEAFQARLVCDRLVRFQISPILSRYTGTDVIITRRHVSVLSCISRARKTRSAITIHMRFNDGLCSTFQRTFETTKQATSFVDRMSRSDFKIAKDDGLVKQKLMPFTTYSLLIFGHSVLFADVQAVLEAAQRLYHFGKITFILTDSLLIKQDAVAKIHRGYVEADSKYKLENLNEAIRVTDQSLPRLEGNIPELDKIIYHAIWKRTMYSQIDDCASRTLTLSCPDADVVTCEVSLSPTLDSDNPFSKESVSDKSILLRSITAFEAAEASISTYDLACFNLETECTSAMYPFDNLDIHGRSHVQWSASPTCRYDANPGSPVTRQQTSSNISLTPVGEKVCAFMEAHFPKLVSSDFIKLIESKFKDIENGKDDWTEVADFVQKSIYPTINRLRKGKAVQEPRAVRHPRSLGFHPSTRQEIKVVKAKYGPCLMMGRGDKCLYFKISKSQYDMLQLDTAVPLLDRRRVLNTRP